MRRLINNLINGKDAPFNFGLWTGLILGFYAYVLEAWWMFPVVALLPVLVEFDRYMNKRKN